MGLWAGLQSTAAILLLGLRADALEYSVLVGFASNAPLELWRLNPNTGGLVQLSQYPAAGNGTAWVDASPDQRFVYTSASQWRQGSGASWLGTTVEPATGLISALSFLGFAGLPPPNNIVSLAYVANTSTVQAVSYGNNSASAFSVDASSGQLAVTVGSMPLCEKAHQVVMLPADGASGLPAGSLIALVPCLGSDEIVVSVTGAVCPGPAGQMCVRSRAPSRAGSGPRHLALHPVAARAYVINELDSSVATWEWDASTLTLSAPTYMSSLPASAPFPGDRSVWAGAEIAVNAGGTVLYVSNRSLKRGVIPGAECSIAAFRLHPFTGVILGPIGWYGASGAVHFPRHFSLSPDGIFLLVANQRGASLSVFSVLSDGSLAYQANYPTGEQPAFVRALPNPLAASPSPPPTSGAGAVARRSTWELAVATAVAGMVASALAFR